MSHRLSDIERQEVREAQFAQGRAHLRLPKIDPSNPYRNFNNNAQSELTRSISIYGTGGEPEYAHSDDYRKGALVWESSVDRTRWGCLHVTIRAAPGCTIDEVLEDQSLPGPNVTSRSDERVTVFAAFKYYTIIMGSGANEDEEAA